MKKVPYEQNNLTDLTPEQVEELKKIYPDIWTITVDDKKCYLHKPNRTILDAAHASSKTANSKFDEVILKSCWLAGDKAIVEDDEYFYGASKQLNELVKFKDAELKKL